MSENNMTVIATDNGDIKLNPAIIMKYLVSGGGKVSEQEAMMFLSLCKFQKLNPFLREAYLVKFGTAAASIIVGKEVFTKRAFKDPRFKGFQAGIIVQRDKDILELEGSFKLKSDVLLGGWCTIYRNDTEHPYVSKVSMDEYNKGKSTWNQIPCTMIRKVALVQGLREAFPDLFQAMYSPEEMPVDNEALEELKAIDIPDKCKVELIETEDVKKEEKKEEAK